MGTRASQAILTPGISSSFSFLGLHNTLLSSFPWSPQHLGLDLSLVSTTPHPSFQLSHYVSGHPHLPVSPSLLDFSVCAFLGASLQLLLFFKIKLSFFNYVSNNTVQDFKKQGEGKSDSLVLLGIWCVSTFPLCPFLT